MAGDIWNSDDTEGRVTAEILFQKVGYLGFGGGREKEIFLEESYDQGKK